jgi:hypothetical protein
VGYSASTACVTVDLSLQGMAQKHGTVRRYGRADRGVEHVSAPVWQRT